MRKWMKGAMPCATFILQGLCEGHSTKHTHTTSGIYQYLTLDYAVRFTGFSD
jgi:hypothetical protein